jgi:drug/metabolite transporter (DMT)-like permease
MARASFLAGFLATIVWGLGTTSMKWLLFVFPPVALLLLQLLASLVFLWTLILLWQRPKISPKLMVRYSLPGLLQPGLAFILGTWGLSLTTASADSVIWAAETIAVLPLAWLMLKEKMTWRLIVLSLIAFGGTVVATAPTIEGQPCPTCWAGNLILVAAVCVAATYNIYTRRQMDGISSHQLLALHQVAALVVIVPAFIVESSLHLGPALKNISAPMILLGCLLGILQYGGAFVLFFSTLRAIGAARSGLLFSLSPIFTLISSYFILGERLTVFQWFGAAVALTAGCSVTWLTGSDEVPSLETVAE